MENNSNNEAQTNNQINTTPVTNSQPIAQVNTKKSKKPFIIAVVVVMWLGSLAGVYFIASRKTTKTSTASTAKVAETNTKTETTSSENTNTSTTVYDSTISPSYSPSGKEYSVVLPAGWKLSLSQDSADLIAWKATDIVYTAGGKSEVVSRETNVMEGKSVAFYLIYNYTKNEKSYLSDKLVKEKNYKSANGVDVTKYKRTQTNEADTNGGMGIPVGTVEYTYDLISGTKNIHIVHDVLKGETDQSKNIETMIETIKFL